MTKRISTLGMIVLYIITLTLQSCQSTAGSPMTPSPEPPTTLTAQALQSSRYTPSPSRAPVTDTPTPTITPIPTKTNTPTRRPTLTMTFTPHPVVVLSNADKIKIMDLLSETEDCRLPCWNGLTPGKSNFWDIQGFYARLGYAYDSSHRSGDFHSGGYNLIMKDFPYRGPIPYLGVYTTWDNDVIQKIEITGWDNLEQYSIKRIVEILGIPDAIYILEAATVDRYRFAFIYSNRGFVIEITGPFHQILPNDNENPFGVCILDNNKKVFTFHLFNIESDSTPVVERYIDYYVELGLAPFQLVNWSQELGITNVELVDQLINHPEECIPYG